MSSSSRLTLGLPSTCSLREMLTIPVDWAGAACGQIFFQTPLRFLSLPWALSPLGILLVSGFRSWIGQDLRPHLACVWNPEAMI